jgi:myo-inositol-1(or 4)-monophosphatase
MSKPLDNNFLAFVATQAALQAGEILRQGFGTEYQITSKPGRQNIVTQYDHASEKSIVDLIKSHFADHVILAEEGGLSKDIQEDDVIWFIDPLDGTSNFAHQIPLFAINIAAYRGHEGLCGIIYQPITNELFIGVKGQGSFLNGKKLKVSPIDKLEEAIILAGFPSESTKHPTISIEELDRLNKTGATSRNLGSAALALAYVAAGKLDGFWMNNLYPWDWSAGKILVEEAGGKITSYSNKGKIYSEPANILASNHKIHKEMLSFIK